MNLISFVLLAGGASTRMGTDKGLVELDGKLMIQHVLDSIKNFLEILNLESDIPVKVVLRDYIQQQEYLDKVPDLTEDQIIIDEVVWNNVYSDIPLPPQGSIFGAWSAMTELKQDYENVFILPCDAPFVSETILTYMIEEYFKNNRLFTNGKNKFLKRKKKRDNQYISYIPKWENGKFEPIFAIYHIRSIQPVLERKILKKLYSLQKTFEEIKEDPKVIGLDEIEYEIDLHEISIEKELGKYDSNFTNFIDVNSSENLKSVEKFISESKQTSA